MSLSEDILLLNLERTDPRLPLQLSEAIGTTSANSAKFRGIRPRMYIKDLF